MAKTAYTSIYDLDYFDASQTFLYVGDVWVDEIVALQYTTTQNKRPLYGYASQLFDDVAAGQVIVQGSFAINFKEQGYLWAVLRRYKQLAIQDAGIGLQYLKEKDRKRIEKHDARLLQGGGGTSRPVVGANGTKIDRASIERIASGNVSRQERYDFYNQLAGYSTVNVKGAIDKEFEDIVEAFEDQVWVTEDNNALNSQVRRTDNNMFDGFDMYVVFGNYANPGANHTVQKIINVNLVSQGKQIQVGGGVILEEYSFFAQTVA